MFFSDIQSKAFLRKLSDEKKITQGECEKFVRNKTHLNDVDEDGKTALILAAYYDYPDVVKMLIDAGASINVRDRTECTALFWASNDNITKMLVAAGADVNARDKWGRTKLMMVSTGSLFALKYLIGAGADVNIEDEKGKSAFRYAMDGLDRFGSDAVSHTSAMRILLEAGADPSGELRASALRMAAGTYRVDVVKMLIESGADVNSKVYDKTALVSATLGRSANIGDVTYEGISGDIAKMLIEAGADVNTADKYGNTILMWAALRDRVDIMEMLIEKGADTNCKPTHGGTLFTRVLCDRQEIIANRIEEVVAQVKGA